ncbi:unnamed protein product [Urochloa humidicola]
MASSSDSWVKEYNEASRLADDISSMIADRRSLPQSGPELCSILQPSREKYLFLELELGVIADQNSSKVNVCSGDSIYVLM